MQHSVFGNAPAPYSLTVGSDNSQAIELATVFYIQDINGPMIGWRCMGARVYIPNDSRVFNQPIRLRLYVGLSNFLPSLGEGQYEREKTTVTPASEGWCEVLWDEPLMIEYGPDQFWMMTSYSFTNPAAQMYYIAASGTPSTAIVSSTLGSSLAMSEAFPDYPRTRRSRFRMGTDDTEFSAAWYGSDILIAEPPAPTSYVPTAAYGFNEGVGTTITDTTGNGYNLTTQPGYFTAGGHTSYGLRQQAVSDMAVTTSVGGFTALDIVATPSFSVIFWGRRGSNGLAGENWTLRQTYSVNHWTSWAIAMSEDSQVVFEARRDGFAERITAAAPPTGEWHHFAMTYNGYVLRGYLDGTLIGATYNSGDADANNNQNLRIFGYSMQSQVIDDLRFFDTALDPDAVGYYMGQTLGDGGRSGKVKVWDGAQWGAHPLKVWDGTTWVLRKAKGFDGTQFMEGKS